MFDNRREIMQDVFLTYLPAQRFKTSRMTVQLIAPLQRETAAARCAAAGYRPLPGYGEPVRRAGYAVRRQYRLYRPQKG